MSVRRARSELALASRLAFACLAAAACARQETPAPEPPSSAVLEHDRRIVPLLDDCPQSGFYDRDLSDLVPVLLSKIERAHLDPLKRAKEELGLLGERAFPATANLFYSYYADPMRSPFLENVVDALSFNATTGSHTLLIEALNHPQDSVRSKALDGLARLALPEDFEVLVARLSIEGRELRRMLVPAIFSADRGRAEHFFLDAIAGGTERDLWISAAPSYSETGDPEVARRCAQLYSGLEGPLAAYLAAGALLVEDAGALEHLRSELRAEAVPSRMAAVNALQRAGKVDELGVVLLEDTSADLRALAAASFRAVELDDKRRDWLRSALTDPSSIVQGEVLAVLCEHGDEQGLARAFEQLSGTPGLLQQALQALRAPLREDAELARRSFQLLLERHALEEHRPPSQRLATFKAIAQHPLREAAEFLRGIALAAGEERLEGLRAHEWLMIQASNTGIPGRSFLAETLVKETDPLRRIDLIDAVASIRDDLARSFLQELVQTGATSPLERLFAGSALIRVGPSWEVAPVLKRVTYAMLGPDEGRARAALQCLLWQWY